MTFTQSIQKAFKECLGELAFFRDWEQTSPREYRRYGADVRLRIDLQFDKRWQPRGGKIAVNMWCGHRWSIPTLGWVEDGYEYGSTRLSPRDHHDHWWQISSANQVREFGTDLPRLLSEFGVQWFEQVSTKHGFLEWYASVFPAPRTFPYLLEVRGPSITRERVRAWLATAPRGIDPCLKWLMQVGLLSEDLAIKMSLASIQAENEYKRRLGLLLQEMEQTMRAESVDASPPPGRESVAPGV